MTADKRLSLVAALYISAVLPDHALAATKYASVNGGWFNSGNSPSSPWDAASCFTTLSAGDKCIYLPGNYGQVDFAPENSGTASRRIIHECQTRFGCSFDRILVLDVAYLTIRNIKSETNYYDASHSSSNPRARVLDSHHIRFDTIFVRGEPQRCADGNPTTGCQGGDSYNRYNDLLQIGDNTGRSSHHIEITGPTQLLNANHHVVGLFDDGDATACEARESNVWVHGTEDEPIIVSMLYHHNFAFKGSCHVLIEYVDFLQAGNGRGDIQQPDRADNDVQAGGTFHGSDYQHVLVRFSTVSRGGSATNMNRNLSHIEVGTFGSNLNRVDGACFAHLSHYQPWGTFALIGRINEVTSVRNVSIINNAVDDAWYMNNNAPARVTSPYAGYLVARAGAADKVSAYIDGIVGDSTFNTNKLLYDNTGTQQHRSFSDAPFVVDGVRVGSNVHRYEQQLFEDPKNRNFSPRANTPLINNASPVASTTSSGSGTSVPIDRPECFMGTMGGMRDGDMIEIGGDQCRVLDVDLQGGELQCADALNWQAGEPIFYRVNGQVVNEIGARSLLNPEITPKPPTLRIVAQPG